MFGDQCKRNVFAIPIFWELVYPCFGQVSTVSTLGLDYLRPLCSTFNVTMSSTTDGTIMFRNRAERVRSTCWPIFPATEVPLDSVLVAC